MLCVFIPSEGSALLSSFDFRATLSRTIFSKKSSRNASRMRTVFLIKESLFDEKVLPRNCHAGHVLRGSCSPSPKIEDAFFFFRMGSLGRHHCYLHRFTVPRKKFLRPHGCHSPELEKWRWVMLYYPWVMLYVDPELWKMSAKQVFFCKSSAYPPHIAQA